MVTHHCEKSNIDGKCISYLQNKNNLEWEERDMFPAISRPKVVHMYTYIQLHIRHRSHAFSPDLLCNEFYQRNTHILKNKWFTTYLTDKAIPCKSKSGERHHLPSQ